MSSLLKIDDIDRSIMKLVQKEPNLTHTEIAKKVNRSQPTIGMRIKKLEEAGVLKFQAGINIKDAEFMLAQVEIQTNKPENIFGKVQKCPFMLNAYKISGQFNISMLVAGNSIKSIDEIVNTSFRKNPDVINVKVQYITEILNDFVLPINFHIIDHYMIDENCKNCMQCTQ